MRLFRRKRHHRVVNYFNTSHARTVLISYITRPFVKGNHLRHTNTREVLAMGKVICDLGFNVDVVYFEDVSPIDYIRYHLIIGFGEPLINYFYHAQKNVITIYYGTGMHVCWQNHASLKRVSEVHQKTGLWMPESGRLVDKAWSIQTTLVDHMICLGNETVLASYKKYFPRKIYQVPVTYYSPFVEEDILREKDFANAKHHFLWLGSRGLVHKGLDLLLDIFKENPDLHLHIAGAIEKEKTFSKYYKQELYATKNIHTYGFIDLASDVYKHLLRTCAFIILPSCSEGQPSSIINPMAYGMVPIVPDTAGVPIEDFGFRLPALTVQDIQQQITACHELSATDLQQRCHSCLMYTRQHHSVDAYCHCLKKALTDILGSHM